MSRLTFTALRKAAGTRKPGPRSATVPLPRSPVYKAQPPGPTTGQLPPPVRVVAIDLDGTLSDQPSYGPLGQAKPRDGAREAVARLRAAGVKVVVWTARNEPKETRQWLAGHGIGFDALNANPWFDTGSRKIVADVYADDKAEDGRLPWPELEKLIWARLGHAKSLPGASAFVVVKARGAPCKPGETAASDGCVPHVRGGGHGPAVPRRRLGEGGTGPYGEHIPSVRQALEKAKAVAAKLGFPPERVKVNAGEPLKFTLNGREETEAGHYSPATKEIVLSGKSMLQGGADRWRGIVAHEVMHGLYDDVMTAFRKERQELARELGVDPNTVLRPTPADHARYPTYTALWPLLEGPKGDAVSELIAWDGLTPYSQEYWKALEGGGADLDTAMTETLSEMARLYEEGSLLPDQSAPWKNFYDAVRHSHAFLRRAGGAAKGQSAAAGLGRASRRKPHLLWLDDDFLPAPPGRATMVRYWAADGRSGFLLVNRGGGVTGVPAGGVAKGHRPGQPVGRGGGYGAVEGLAPEAMRELEDVLRSTGLPLVVTGDAPLGELESACRRPGGFTVLAPLKGRRRSEEKVENDYRGDWRRLLDAYRGTVACDTLRDLARARKVLEDRLRVTAAPEGGKVPLRFKDRFAEPVNGGYRDWLANYTLPCGAVCEVQYHLKPYLVAREKVAVAYDVLRGIKTAMEEEGRDRMTDAEKTARRRVRRLTAETFDLAQAECEASGALQKSSPRNVLKGLTAKDSARGTFAPNSKGAGQPCKPGERADLTRCVPDQGGLAGGAPAAGPSAAPYDAAADYRANGVRAKSFKAWFGDWENDPEHASKAVGPSGEPAPEYQLAAHGGAGRGPRPVFTGSTHGAFSRFDKKFIADDVLYGHGFYFTESEEIAGAYAGSTHRADAGDAALWGMGGQSQADVRPAVMRCYLNARNPLQLDHPLPDDVLGAARSELAPLLDGLKQFGRFSKEGFEALLYGEEYRKSAGLPELPGRPDPDDPLASLPGGVYAGQLFEAARQKAGASGVRAVTDWLQKRGYDSTRRLDRWAPNLTPEKITGRPHTWVVFEPSQVKAENNAGTFDPGDDDITKSPRRPAVAKALPRNVLKGRGQPCKPGETAASDGCVPANKPSAGPPRTSAIDPANVTAGGEGFFRDVLYREGGRDRRMGVYLQSGFVGGSDGPAVFRYVAQEAGAQVEYSVGPWRSTAEHARQAADDFVRNFAAAKGGQVLGDEGQDVSEPHTRTPTPSAPPLPPPGMDEGEARGPVIPELGPALGSGPHSDVRRRLTTTPQTAAYQRSGSANGVYRLTLADGSVGWYKPSTEEDDGLRSGVPVGEYYKREVASSLFADALGFGDIVPVTAFRTQVRKANQYRPEDEEIHGSIMADVPGEDARNVADDGERYDGERDSVRAALFDYLAGHQDRHAGNWRLTPEGKIRLTDNGLSFPEFYDDDDFPVGHSMEMVRKAVEEGAVVPQDLVGGLKGKWPAAEKALRDAGLGGRAVALAKERFDAVADGKYKFFRDLPLPLSNSDDLAGLFGLSPPGRPGGSAVEE